MTDRPEHRIRHGCLVGLVILAILSVVVQGTLLILTKHNLDATIAKTRVPVSLVAYKRLAAEIRSLDIVLPTGANKEIRLRTVARPEQHLAILLQKLDFPLPNKPKQI